MTLKQFLNENMLYLDGGMGTLLQSRGLAAGEKPEAWNLTHADEIIAIHKAYFDAGANIVNTNTFGANSLKFSDGELEKIISAAIENARIAARDSIGAQPKWVALDIGPTGKMLRPYGDLNFEDAVEIFAKAVRLGAKYGADLVFIETMSDSYETKAALLAAKENCSLPVFVSNAYGEDGKLMTGADPAAMVAMLEGMGADAIGVNCSLGPKALGGVVEKYLERASTPIILKPNAGLPRAVDGETVFDVTADEFASDMADFARLGVRVLGGCCGTTPEYIAATLKATADIAPVLVSQKNISCVSSYTHAVTFGNAPVLIGERINPTGKKKFKEALRARDMDYILKEGIAEEEAGVHILDVNVGLPDIDEQKMLVDAVCALQAVSALPLQIDTSDTAAMESALRVYNGKAMINSLSGKKESMDAVFPLVKKYGGLVVALTLDEDGIPPCAEGRVAIAKKILAEAKKYGLDKKDIIFDPLCLTVSADKYAAVQTLKAVNLITKELGCHTSLGVSNVSFGLPARDIINGAFFTQALARGLSAAIMNPYSAEMMKAYYAYLALSGADENCERYIQFASNLQAEAVGAPAVAPKATDESGSELVRAIVKGLASRAAELTRALVTERDPLDVVQGEIIPALDRVGVGFENKTVYLPQLLMSAEAAGAAFEVIKANMPADKSAKRCEFVLATVKGDIHDIGKNIVKLILENYGFTVIDLGRDTPPELIALETVKRHAPIVGLSALMTTTVPAMEETVKLLRERAPWCKIIVGGAVLTESYARTIGADKYAKDAMEAVRYAEEIEKTL